MIKYSFLLCFLFCSSISYSQFYQLRNFNSESGLPSSDVYGMMQDSKGYMWFATDMGVSRYNGYEFKNYSTENGLADNTIFGFFEDSKNRIWFRSLSGKLSYFLNDSIYSIPCNLSLELKIQNQGYVAISFYVDNSDTLWIGTYKKIIKIAPPWNLTNVSDIVLPHKGNFIYQITNKAFIYGGSNQDNPFLNIYNKSFKKTLRITTPLLAFKNPNDQRFYVTRMSNGTFLASMGNIILQINNKGILSKHSEDNVIISHFEDLEKRIITTSRNGIRIYRDRKLNAFETIPALEGKTITGVLIDHENSLWLSAEGQGVFCIPFQNNRYYTEANGLTYSKINAMVVAGQKIITGHLDGSLSIINKNVILPKKISEKNNPHQQIKSLYALDDAAIYVGSAIGSFQLSGDNFNLQTNLKKYQFKKIVRINNHLFWGLPSTRLLVFNIQKDTAPVFNIPFHYYTNDIYLDKKNTLWICAVNGIWNYSNDSLIYMGDKNEIYKNRVINILEDKQGRIWMASRGKGIIVKDGNKFYTITSRNGLADNMCRNMFLDSNNIVWVGSNKGLSKISFSDQKKFSYKITTYTKYHGLLTNEVNFICKSGSDLILAHNTGISIFNPASLKSNSVPPPVYVTNVTVNKKIFKKKRLTLNYSQNYLRINYVGLSYKNPGSLEYKYKMEGLDTSWVYTKYTSAQFQTLYPGEYTFAVYAKNDDGYWSTVPAVMHINILPLWWQTRLFKTAIPLFALFLTFLVVRLWFKRAQKREREKTELQLKVASTELKALRAQMNPHFVYNTLNSIQHFITDNDPDSSQRYLSKFAKLIRYVVDNSKLTAIPLEREIEAIKLYLELESLRFEDKFDYKILIGNNVDTNYVYVPSMLIQPYLENSILHGIMHKQGKGFIEINFDLIDNNLKCRIADNGIGRKRSQELKKNDSFHQHKSVGMTITQERLEILNTMNNSALSVSITDLTDNQGNATGTLVELFIPLN